MAIKPTSQSRQEVIISAPLQKVWELGQDLTKIPQYHPRVNKVNLISGQSQRCAGVAYQCHLSDGKDTCIEKDLIYCAVVTPNLVPFSAYAQIPAKRYRSANAKPGEHGLEGQARWKAARSVRS
jgi:hypothetical protein